MKPTADRGKNVGYSAQHGNFNRRRLEATHGKEKTGRKQQLHGLVVASRLGATLVVWRPHPVQAKSPMQSRVQSLIGHRRASNLRPLDSRRAMPCLLLGC